ncbi:hypothetical protein CASFOL_038587 [Castilleja foliolosa]|uniref:FKB95-like N-terminal Kelch domain-containing protein n=1 Tax=Castilleja foliolosa TaxID=1961234 RepID=A0ABD3BMN3_9LAMI
MALCALLCSFTSNFLVLILLHISTKETRGMAYTAVASDNEGKSSSSHQNSFVPLSSSPVSSEEISMFCLMIDYCTTDQRSFNCIVMDKSTGKTNDLTISPAPNTEEPNFALVYYTVVSIGPTIYVIGGACRSHFCPDDDDVIHPLHVHAEVRVFNPSRPEDGWRDVAPMNIPRLQPAAVVVDGMIYVFGGFNPEEDTEDGEWYDPNTDTWHLFSAEGYRPSFACVEASYVDPSGAKKVLVKSRRHDKQSLYMFLLDERRWESVISLDFEDCLSSCVIGNIIYALVDNHKYDDEYDKKKYEKQPLQSYHLIHKQWFPVELPPEIRINARATHIIASGSDRLCLMFHKFVKGKGPEPNRMTCLEIRLNEEYTTGSGSDGMMILRKISATKVSSTYFDVRYKEFRRIVIAL